MHFTKSQCVSLNYLIEELIFAEVPFRFVTPIGEKNSIKLEWRSSSDQVDVVSRIVSRAVELNATVLIGTVDAQQDRTAYYVGFDTEAGIDNLKEAS